MQSPSMNRNRRAYRPRVSKIASIGVICLCAAGCIAAPALEAAANDTTAEDAVVPTPVSEASQSGEILNAEVPQGWVQVVDRVVGNLAINEYVPADTVDVWLQKLSYESLRRSDAAGVALPDPLEYSKGIAEQQDSRCEAFTDNVVFAGFENGYQTAVHMMQCGQSKLTGKPLITMLKVIRGNDALYSITRIWRLGLEEDGQEASPREQDTEDQVPATDASKSKTGLDSVPQNIRDEVAAWSQVLRRVQLCHHDLAAHRCASKVASD